MTLRTITVRLALISLPCLLLSLNLSEGVADNERYFSPQQGRCAVREEQVTLTPNYSSAGFVVSQVTVTDIPAECFGSTYLFTVTDEAGAPLAKASTTATGASLSVALNAPVLASEVGAVTATIH